MYLGDQSPDATLMLQLWGQRIGACPRWVSEVTLGSPLRRVSGWQSNQPNVTCVQEGMKGELVMVPMGPTWGPKPEGSGHCSRSQGGPAPWRAPWPFSVHSGSLLGRPRGLCHPESSHTHLDWVLLRLWQPVFGKLGEGGLGRG